MRRKMMTQVTGAALLAVLAMPAQMIAQDEQEHKGERFPHYRVKDLGTLGGMVSLALGLNNRGHVGGGASLPNGNQHAFLWRRGHMLDLGTLGGPNSFAGKPNATDELGIEAETSTPDPLGENFCGFGTGLICLATVWKQGAMGRPFPTLGGNNAYALDINNRGQTVGIAENSTRDLSCASATASQVLDYEAALWEPNGDIHELRALHGDSVGFALSINNRGQAVGSSGLCGNTPLFPLQVGPHAVLWEKDGTPRDLGSLGGKLNNTAAALNDRGEVVGASDLRGDTTIHSFLWTKHTGMQDLGTVGKDLASLPGGMGGINNKGQVVGESCDVNPLTAQTPPNCRGYLWQNKQMKDLNDLIPADSPLYLLIGFGINDRGEIAGFGLVKGTTDIHGFLAIPCDRDDGGTDCCEDHDKDR